MMLQFAIETKQKHELIDITDKINNLVLNSGVRHGVCNVFTPHSTAAIVVMENADLGLHDDFLCKLDELVPDKDKYKHNKMGEKNAAAHIKSALINPNVALVVDHGRLVLGQWQGVMFCEFDGPRERAIYVQLASE